MLQCGQHRQSLHRQDVIRPAVSTTATKKMLSIRPCRMVHDWNVVWAGLLDIVCISCFISLSRRMILTYSSLCYNKHEYLTFPLYIIPLIPHIFIYHKNYTSSANDGTAKYKTPVARPSASTKGGKTERIKSFKSQ